MSGSVYFGESGRKSEVSELRKLLEQSDLQREPAQYTKVLQRVIACMTMGMDMASLFMHMIKAGATHNLVQKKLVYLYICTYAKSNPQLALLTVNTLTKDSQDRSAMVRGLALRSMSSLRLPDLLEYIEEPVVEGLKDPSRYVRRTAVMSCIKLHHLNPDFVEEHGVVQKLQAMIQDEDPQVMCNCLSALDEILAAEGGVVVGHKLANFLMKRLSSMSEWGQCQAMELLTRYTPSDLQELYDILNIMDVYLKTPNGGVAMACVKLFLHLTKDASHLEDDVFERIQGPLLTMLTSSNYELTYTALCHIEVLINRRPQLFINGYKMFFSRFNDPQFVRRKKLQILTVVSSESNVEEVVTELSANVHDVNVELAKESIHAIGQIALTVPSASEYCTDTLLSFLSCEIEYITSKTLVVIRDLFPRYEKSCLAVLPQLKECLDLVQDPLGKAAIVWIIGEYGQFIPDSPYMLESLVDTIGEEAAAEVRLQLLTAMMKLFFRKPPECQEMLGRLLAHCVDNDMDVDVHDRALLYYRLLKTGVKEAQKVVCGAVETLTSPLTNKSGDQQTLKDPLLSEFNTLSVVYGQPSVTFVSQTIPYIKGQPYTIDEGTPINQPRTDSQGVQSQGVQSQGVQSQGVQSQGVQSQSIPSQGVQSQDSNTRQVIVGDLLGDDLSSLTQRTSGLHLVPRPSLSPAEFQTKWATCQQSSSFQLDVCSVPGDPGAFQESMTSRNIMMMASSPPGQPTQKYFLFAQQDVGGGFFLIETTINTVRRSVTTTVKAEDDATLNEFVQQYKEFLVAGGLV